MNKTIVFGCIFLILTSLIPISYSFEISSNDIIHVDNDVTEDYWARLLPSGETYNISPILWTEKENYMMKARAKDVREVESNWDTLTVSMPMQNHIINEQDNNITISIQGGLGIKFEICNYGNTSLFFVNWSITIDGALVFLGKSNSGCISEIPPGECVTIETFLIIGIGSINITIEIEDTILSSNGYLIGPFVFLI